MNLPAPNVLFRCEASREIGGGHAMRCLALADALADRGWMPCFATRADSADVAPGLARYPRLAPSEENGLRRVAPGDFDLAVVDGYEFDRADETSLRRRARRIAVIDDLADRPHDCDVLIDQTVDRAADDYRALVPSACRVLAGSAYAILRPEFARLRPAALARRTAGTAGRVLLSFGASDPKGLAVALASALLERSDTPAIDLVPDRAGLDAAHALAVAHPGRIEVHYRTDDMAGLMVRADLAAGAVGTTSWERCALGLPTLAVVTAENQRLIASRLAAAGAIELLDAAAGPAGAAERIAALARDPVRRAAMTAAAAALVDGRGLDRIFFRLCPAQRAPGEVKVALRAMEAADLEAVFEWQNQKGQRRFSRDPRAPTWSGHRDWFESRIADPDWLLSIVEADGKACGILQFRRLESGAREVSILVDARAQGRGLGAASLRAARAAMPRAVLEAEIAPDNAASLAIFAKAGYRRTGERFASVPPIV